MIIPTHFQCLYTVVLYYDKNEKNYRKKLNLKNEENNRVARPFSAFCNVFKRLKYYVCVFCFYVWLT